MAPEERDLFTYTSGRYLYNEKLRLIERHVEFNVRALKSIAARSVGRESVTGITKLAEGGFNRVFLLTMNDGFEAIVKIPYLHTVPKMFTTESEVATLDFLHSNGIPVPKVYSWSSKTDNEVGTEYIIMEKASGKPLTDCWFNLSAKERVNLVTSFVNIEKRLFSFRFGAHGSLHYKKNLPQHLQANLYAPGSQADGDAASRFCIGPIADYTFWRGRRADFDIHRGPWVDHREYLHDVGRRELEWTKKFGNPLRNDFPHCILLPSKAHPDTYIDLLEKYLLLAPYLLPQDPNSPLNQPTLRHPDLNPGNIFVSDTCEVSCLIDWQYTAILPLLLVSGNPPMFDNPDDEPPKNFDKPSLPPDYENLRADERSQADELHRRRMLFWLYMIFNGKDNKPHLDALRHPLAMPRQHLVERAGHQWTGNTVTLKGAVLRVVMNWDLILGRKAGTVKCPVSFDEKEQEEFFETEDKWFKANILVEYWRSLLDNVSQDGWVRNESYDKVAATNQKLKKEWYAEAEDDDDRLCVEQHWPFQDHEEVD
ncbi:hypothetical protein LOZ57_003128 [Ophidiomyces ophidiicola]|uniref:uncharacterized protein n=1 Tax=Ophidiomyces ophidiicola TaxID=1387563 RepID=UPI0020C55CA1|nr:uncharacterized protein LOZ57_003128 [Ophidiomyces ophidiicola]KAI1947402.1 hypothetical protein LOZ57_003128 [Ophidiomyces ophidiicola]KAI2043387.1 hypothetical protein LOZ43_006627 [Ophidiomyces ophidiicola]